jgi:MFS family permease
MSSLRVAWRSPGLRTLLASQVPADFADWLDYVAVATLLAFVWEAPTIAFAALAVCLGGPYLLVGPLAGVLVDRWPLRAVLVGSNLGRAAATAALALAPSWPALVALVAVRSAVDAFYTPAKQAAIQALVPEEGRMAANGASHAVNQASKIAAPAAGGALLLAVEPGTVFLANAGLSVLAALTLLRLARLPAADAGGDGLAGGVREGWRIVAARPVLRRALVLMAGGFFAMFLYDTLIAPLTRELGFSQATLGLSLACVGAGGVAASGALMLVSGRPFLLVGLSALVSAGCAATLGAAEVTGPWLPEAAFLGLSACLGVASAATVVPIRTVIQAETPPDRIARVTALSEAANTLALVSAPFLGAALAAATSVGAAFLAGAAVLVLLAAMALR